MPARPIPVRHCRSYGDAPLPSGQEALDQPFSAFPSWFMRITCDRCGKDRMLNEAHTPQRDLRIRVLLARMRRRGGTHVEGRSVPQARLGRHRKGGAEPALEVVGGDAARLRAPRSGASVDHDTPDCKAVPAALHPHRCGEAGAPRPLPERTQGQRLPARGTSEEPIHARPHCHLRAPLQAPAAEEAGGTADRPGNRHQARSRGYADVRKPVCASRQTGRIGAQCTIWGAAGGH